MGLKISRTALADALIADFVAVVEWFAKERRDWLAHQAFVEAEKLHPVADPMLRHEPYPPPLAHSTVMAAVNERGEVDLEIVDDRKAEVA